MPKNDLTNQKFGRLTALNVVGRSGYITSKWLCLCECGNEVVVHGNNLISGNSKSCGCLKLERLISRSLKHGDCGTRLYNIYFHVIGRCENINNKSYKYYGGRGIKVCDEWRKSYIEFKNWAISNGYKNNLEIDRIDNDGNYSPDNCQWITHSENSRAGKRRIQTSNKTGFIGVCYAKDKNKFVAHLNYKNIRYYSGSFNSPEEAYEARVSLEIKHIGKRVTFCNPPIDKNLIKTYN